MTIFTCEIHGKLIFFNIFKFTLKYGFFFSFRRVEKKIVSHFELKYLKKIFLITFQPEHRGSYVCVATNSAGRDQQSITVEVHVPPIITTLPKSQDILQGDSFTLNCEAAGNPTPSIIWLLNNTQITGKLLHFFVLQFHTFQFKLMILKSF